MDVIPFEGFSGVRLGMSGDEVREFLGEPDSMSSDPEHGSERWNYYDLGVELDFSDDDSWLLGCITFKSESFCVKGVSIIGRSEEELRELSEAGVLKGLLLDLELPELDVRNYDCDGLGLSFWVADGVVPSMTLYPRYDESGNQPLWPKGPEGDKGDPAS